MIAIYAILYLAGAVLTYGVVLAAYQREYPRIAEDQWWRNVLHAVIVSSVWPIGLPTHLLFFIGNPYHGLMYRRPGGKT